MSIDSSLVRTLNTWGEHSRTLVHICSNDLVYLVILIFVLWFAARILRAHPLPNDWRGMVTSLLVKGVVIFAIPVGIAVLVSELISSIYVRQRPFAVDSRVKLLVPHAADGGMPSHHVVFMVTLAVSVYFYDRRIAAVLALLTLISGIARVAAGIHYPTDIVAGAVLGAVIVCLYRWALVKFAGDKRLALD